MAKNSFAARGNRILEKDTLDGAERFMWNSG
jgi:hypothetical protein